MPSDGITPFANSRSEIIIHVIQRQIVTSSFRFRKTNPIFRRACTEISFSSLPNSTHFSGVEFIDENGGGAGLRLRKPSETKPKTK